MSGSNRLINSKNTIEGNSQEKLASELKNGNAEAISDTKEGIPMKSNRGVGKKK